MEGTAYPPRVQTDPLTAVQRIGRKAAYNGLYGGLIIALLSHVIPVSSRDFTPYYIRLWEEALRRDLKGYMLVEVEVDMVDNDEKKDEPKEPEPEPPPPEPEPEPDPVQPDVIDPPDPVDPPDPTDPPPEDETPPPDDPYADIEPPPEAAQVGNALTAEGVDLTGEGLVTNPHGEGYKGGYSSSKGTGKTAQTNPNAKTGGKPGGRGTGPAKPRPKYTGPNLSAQPQAIGGWNCGFPPQADLEQINNAIVIISVTVNSQGRAVRVHVQTDPGYGFGSLAKSCAMAKRYKPGKDRAGKPTTKTQAYRIRFRR